MSHFGFHYVGEKVMDRRKVSQNYHWADRNGRMYLCGCMPCFRVGDEVKVPAGKRIKSTKSERMRRYS